MTINLINTKDSMGMDTGTGMDMGMVDSKDIRNLELIRHLRLIQLKMVSQIQIQIQMDVCQNRNLRTMDESFDPLDLSFHSEHQCY